MNKLKYTLLIALLLLCAGLPARALTALATDEKPQLSVRVDGGRIYPGDPISPAPRVEITVTSSNSVTAGRLKIGSVNQNLPFTPAGSYRYISTYEVTSALPDGQYCLTVEAGDNYGNVQTWEAFPLYAQGGSEPAVQGFALSYPNPFDPGRESVAIGYSLSRPAGVTVNIFDLAGKLVTKRSYPAGQPGGRAGYNEASWDGRSDTGGLAGNGIYLFVITADGALVRNGQGKITVFKR